MPYLLDTDVFIDYLTGEEMAKVLVERLASDVLGVSIVTWMESLQGVLMSDDPALARGRHSAVISAIVVEPFTMQVAERCAYLRRDLQLQGRRVRPRALDLIIAATALEHGHTLVTRNGGDFQDIAGFNC